MNAALALFIIFAVTVALQTAAFYYLSEPVADTEPSLTLSAIATIASVGLTGFTFTLTGTASPIVTQVVLYALVIVINSGAVTMLFRTSIGRGTALYLLTLVVTVPVALALGWVLDPKIPASGALLWVALREYFPSGS